MPPQNITNRELNRALLARQNLLSKTDSIANAMQTHIALQTQEHEPHYISLWSRVNNLQKSDVDIALKSKELVRGTTLRNTIHSSTRNDYLLIRPLVQQTFIRQLQRMLPESDIPALMDKATTQLKGQKVSRPELEKLFYQSFSTEQEAEALSGFVGRATLHLVRVPREMDGNFTGQKDVWMLSEEWLETDIPQTTDKLLDDLVLRYLAGFGPASPSDFSSWSGITGIKASFDRQNEKLLQFKAEDGRTLYDLPEAPRPKENIPSPPRIFGQFDNINLAYKNRERITSKEFVNTYTLYMPPRNFGIFTTDGFLDGQWKLDKEHQTIIVKRTEPLTKIQQDALSQELQIFTSDLYGIKDLHIKFQEL